MTVGDEISYRILKALDGNPRMTQRELARELGVSLGKVNYSLRAVINRSWVRARAVQSGEGGRAYVYVLTARGFEQKARIATRFLKYKLEEYQAIEKEIEQLRLEAVQDSARSERRRA